jgi:hypothetical protein
VAPCPPGYYSAIVDQQPATEGKPSITYRHAGDRALLVEYGDMELDLTLNFFVLAVDRALRALELEGLTEAAPGFRSILVSYDPQELPASELLDQLRTVHHDLPSEREMEIPSRRLKLPVVFDDSQSRKAVKRYTDSIRADAPNCEGGNNIDYVVRYNGGRVRGSRHGRARWALEDRPAAAGRRHRALPRGDDRAGGGPEPGARPAPDRGESRGRLIRLRAAPAR